MLLSTIESHPLKLLEQTLKNPLQSLLIYVY